MTVRNFALDEQRMELLSRLFEEKVPIEELAHHLILPAPASSEEQFQKHQEDVLLRNEVLECQLEVMKQEIKKLQERNALLVNNLTAVYQTSLIRMRFLNSEIMVLRKQLQSLVKDGSMPINQDSLGFCEEGNPSDLSSVNLTFSGNFTSKGIIPNADINSIQNATNSETFQENNRSLPNKEPAQQAVNECFFGISSAASASVCAKIVSSVSECRFDCEKSSSSDFSGNSHESEECKVLQNPIKRSDCFERAADGEVSVTVTDTDSYRNSTQKEVPTSTFQTASQRISSTETSVVDRLGNVSPSLKSNSISVMTENKLYNSTTSNCAVKTGPIECLSNKAVFSFEEINSKKKFPAASDKESSDKSLSPSLSKKAEDKVLPSVSNKKADNNEHLESYAIATSSQLENTEATDFVNSQKQRAQSLKKKKVPTATLR